MLCCKSSSWVTGYDVFVFTDVLPSGNNHESRNERALAVYSRVEDKLTGIYGSIRRSVILL